MKAQARLIFRGSGENDGLIIGATLKGQTFFEPNQVYELVECMGEVMIRKLGQSIVGTMEEGHANWPIRHLSWASSIDTILGEGDRELMLTREEYAQIQAQRKKENEERY